MTCRLLRPTTYADRTFEAGTAVVVVPLESVDEHSPIRRLWQRERQRGAPVEVVRLDGEERLRTVPRESVELVQAQETPQAPPASTLPWPRFVALDLETTGFGGQDRVFEWSVVAFDEGREVFARSGLVDPGRPIPPIVARLTGVSDRDVKGKPAFGEVAELLHRWIAGRVVAAHNLPFDRRMLNAEFVRLGMNWPKTDGEVCTQKEAARVGLKRPKLDELCRALGVQLDTHHRALDDARACGLCLWALQNNTAPQKLLGL